MEENLEVKDEGKKDDVKEVQLSPEERRAIDLGWKPKDQWQGNEDDWVPAKWWLKYGDLEQTKIALEQQDKHKERVINAMKNRYMRVKEDSVKEALDIIKRQKREAMKEENFQAVAELDAQAELLKEGLENKFKQADAEFAQQDTQVNTPPPEFYRWNRENSWYKFGDTTDPMTVEADTLAFAIRSRNPNASYNEILSTVTEKIKRMFPEKFKKEPDPVNAVDEGSETGSRASKGTKSSYKLDAAQKEAAMRFGMTEAEYAKEIAEWERRKGR